MSVLIVIQLLHLLRRLNIIDNGVLLNISVGDIRYNIRRYGEWVKYTQRRDKIQISDTN